MTMIVLSIMGRGVLLWFLLATTAHSLSLFKRHRGPSRMLKGGEGIKELPAGILLLQQPVVPQENHESNLLMAKPNDIYRLRWSFLGGVKIDKQSGIDTWKTEFRVYDPYRFCRLWTWRDTHVLRHTPSGEDVAVLQRSLFDDSYFLRTLEPQYPKHSPEADVVLNPGYGKGRERRPLYRYATMRKTEYGTSQDITGGPRQGQLWVGRLSLCKTMRVFHDRHSIERAKVAYQPRVLQRLFSGVYIRRPTRIVLQSSSVDFDHAKELVWWQWFVNRRC